MVQQRTDHVGSLLRPAELLAARAEFSAGSIDADAMMAAEDSAIMDALAMQRDVGMEVFTDGELRRAAWMTDLAEAVDGFVDDHVILRWHSADGTSEELPSYSKVAGAKLQQAGRITSYEFDFLKRHASGPVKMTMPSPAVIATNGYKKGISDAAYGTREELLADVTAIVKGEVQALVADGAAYIQLDEGFYRYVGDGAEALSRQTGQDSEERLANDIAAENACYDAVPTDSVTFGMHICRGNSRSRWVGTGGYDWLAERLFSELRVDRFLLEYDSERAGGFEPLRFLPKGKTVVLGLVSTKFSEMEDVDQLLRRIDEAAKYVSADQLAISPQCGFASVAAGNRISVDDQRRKLELVVETARRAWG